GPSTRAASMEGVQQHQMKPEGKGWGGGSSWGGNWGKGWGGKWGGSKGGFFGGLKGGMKGSWGKDKGKSKMKWPSGPNLSRARISTEPVTGEVVEWKGKYGWIQPTVPVEHPMSDKHQGRIYVSMSDLQGGLEALTVGSLCQFHLFQDASGLGAEEESPEPDLASAWATRAAWWPGDASAITMQAGKDIWYSEPAAGYKRLRTTPTAWVPRLSSQVDKNSDGPRPPSTPPPSSLQPNPKSQVWPVRSRQFRSSTSRVWAPRAAKALPTAAPDLAQNLQKKPQSRPAPSYVPARPKYAPSAVPPVKAFEPEAQEYADESVEDMPRLAEEEPDNAHDDVPNVDLDSHEQVPDDGAFPDEGFAEVTEGAEGLEEEADEGELIQEDDSLWAAAADSKAELRRVSEKLRETEAALAALEEDCTQMSPENEEVEEVVVDAADQEAALDAAEVGVPTSTSTPAPTIDWPPLGEAWPLQRSASSLSPAVLRQLPISTRSVASPSQIG
ncbi:unnamed protein product, partial [Symbiodinium sp. CCMP2456]